MESLSAHVCSDQLLNELVNIFIPHATTQPVVGVWEVWRNYECGGMGCEEWVCDECRVWKVGVWLSVGMWGVWECDDCMGVRNVCWVQDVRSEVRGVWGEKDGVGAVVYTYWNVCTYTNWCCLVWCLQESRADLQDKEREHVIPFQASARIIHSSAGLSYSRVSGVNVHAHTLHYTTHPSLFPDVCSVWCTSWQQ